MKIVIDKFDGISSIKRNAGLSMFDENTRDIMPQRERGYLLPGYSEVTRINSTTLTGLILDATPDPDAPAGVAAGRMYAIDNDKLYRMYGNGSSITTTGSFPHAITGGKEVIFYNIGTARNLMYVKSTTMGMYDNTNFDDDWYSTVPANAHSPAFTNSTVHPKLIWKTYLWIGDGRYLQKLDGQTGANGTVNYQALDLGVEWEITSLFNTQNYIGICAREKPNGSDVNNLRSMIFFWDGTSSVSNYMSPLIAGKIVGSYNFNGTVYLITYKNGIHNLERLTDSGTVQVRKLYYIIDGTERLFTPPKNCITDFDGHVVIGACASLYRNALFSYGNESPEIDKSFNQICSSTATSPSSVGYVGRLGNFGSIFASYRAGQAETRYYWTIHNANGYSPNATYRGNYIDLGQKAVLNYVEVFFRPLVSGDSITVGLDSNYGTSTTIQQEGGIVSFSKDGAITSKKFDLAQIECHAFRPTISWSSGGVAISKIVVDYSFIDN